MGVKFHPRTGHEDPEGEQVYSFFNLGARWGLVVNAKIRPLYPRERPGTQCIGSWVSPRGRSRRVWKISPPTGIRSPDRPTRRKSLAEEVSGWCCAPELQKGNRSRVVVCYRIFRNSSFSGGGGYRTVTFTMLTNTWYCHHPKQLHCASVF